MIAPAPANPDAVRPAMAGTWVSLAPEIRPSKNPDGTLKPLYLSRTFTYRVEDRFELAVMNCADPFGKVAIEGFARWEIGKKQDVGDVPPAVETGRGGD